MKKLSGWVLYALFFAGAALFFLYYLFPAQGVKAYIKRDLNRGYPDFSVNIQDLKPAIPPGVKCLDLTLFFQERPLFTAGKITFLPRPGSLLRPGAVFTYRGEVHSGSLDGKIDLREIVRPRNIRVEADFRDVQLAQVPALAAMYGVKISGRLNAAIGYSENESISNVTAVLTAANGAVTFPKPFFDIEAVDFKSIKAELNMTNQRLNIKHVTLSGPQLEGSVVGSIKVMNPIEGSILNLRATLRPHRVFLADLKKKIPAPLFPKKRPGATGFSIRIGGTFERPSLAFR